MFKIHDIKRSGVTMIKRFSVLILFLTAGITGSSQTDSLSHYLTLAARNNPVVLQNYFEYQAALKKIPQAGALQDPQVDLGMFLTPMELIAGNQVAEIQLMQMFPWFGTLRSAKDEMSYMANAKYENLRDSKLQVFYDVQKTWYELYKLKQEIRISERNVEILRILERLAKVKFTIVPTGSVSSPGTGTMTNGRNGPASGNQSGMQGMGNTSQGSVANQPSAKQSGTMQDNSMGSTSSNFGLADLYRIQIELGELHNNLALLRTNINVAQIRFNSFLNRPAEMHVFIPDSISVDTTGVILHSLKDSMMANNPMLHMLEFERKSLQAKKKMVTRMGYPMVGLGLNYSVINKNEMSDSEMNGEDMIMPMMSVTLPVYRKKYRAMRNEADFLIESVAQQQIAASNNLITEYNEALQYYEDSKRRLKLYGDQGKLVKSSLNILISDFTTSSSGLTEILRLRQQVLDYDFRFVEALTDYYTSVAWLKRLGAMKYYH